MGITVELWRARIGLFSGGRGSRPHSKASSTKHQPLYFSDTVCSTAKVVQGGLLLLYILKFLSSQDKTKFLKRTRNVGLLVILIAVLLHSLAHLLLLAGDVESNPGPRMDGTLTLNDLNKAHSKLSESRNRWFEIGQAINVDDVTLDSIRKQYGYDNSTCLRKMLDHRLKSGPPLTSWKELLNSLRTQSSMQVSGAADQKRPLSSEETPSAKHIRSISPPGLSAPVNLPSLMYTYHLTTAQVDSKIRQKDISYLAVHFDNVEHYVDAMELTPGEKNDVKKCANHREAMIKCLNIWIRKKCSQVTFRILLDMLVKLKKEEIASKVCQYLAAAPMDPDATDPMSTQTQYPSTNATSAVTLASPALHNYSTVSNHPGIALSAHHHSHLPEPPGYGTSQWYGATTNHPRPSLAPFGMPRMLSYPRYPYVPNASGHGMPQGYPTAYGSQYSEPRYLPPAVVPPTYGGHVPHDYHNTIANWYPQTIGMNTPHSMTMMPYGYLPQHPVVNTLYGNVANVHNPPHTRATLLKFPINASHRPPLQRETIPPAVEVYTSLPYNVSSDFSSPLVSQSEESSILSNQVNTQENALPITPIGLLHNDSSAINSPPANRLCLTDNLEQPGPSSTNSTPNATGSDQLDSHDTTQRLRQILSENNFKLVYEKLYPIRSEWSNFGIALDLPPSTIEQISKDHKSCEDCFYETLDRLFKNRELTWSKIIEALRKPTLQQNNLATEIESAVVAMDPPTLAPVSLAGNLSLEKLCLIPVDKVWYQLGLWLGVKEYILIKIKTKDEKTKLFKAFLEFLYSSTDYKNIISQQEKEQAQSLLESENYYEFIKLFPSDKIYSRKVVEISKCLFPRLLTALVKVGKRDVAENICSNRGVLLTDLIDSKLPPECVVVYADYLKSKYREMSLIPDPNWPPSIATKEHYTNLALIQKERNSIQTEKDISSVTKDYAHGNIDSIIAKKTNIDLEEAFYPIINLKTNENRLTILMDGAPGVGKTTITRKVCIDWAEGDVLPEYQLVVLVSLRELNILDKQIHLSDILPSDSKELLQNVIKHMMQVSGAGTLIIFDGFDELSSQERNFLQQSLVLDIIRGSKLHLCSVMITSRPYASQPLRSLSRVNRRIEVLGFTEEQIHDCVCTDIPGKEGKKLIQKLKERLDIVSLCYIPLNCRILLFVYKIERFSLPSTITELYEIFLLHTIKRFAQFKKVEDEIISAKKLTELPHVITVQLNALSKFALEGIEQGKLVFDNKNLKEHVSLGLLNSLHCFTTTGEAAFFQFLHLTIQEFLAARYVASDAMTDKERKSFMRSNIENETYRMTLLFLAGLTGFSFLSIGDSLLQPQSTFLSGSSKKERIVFLSQIIYESKNSSNCILSHLNGSLDMSDYSLTEFDCLVLAHLMSNTPQDFVWEVIDLSSCGITSFSVFLETKHSKHTMIPGILVSKTVSFSNRNMKQVEYNSSIPIASVVDFLSSSKDSPLEELTLPVVELKECQQVLQLSQALINLKSLQKLKIIVPGLNKLSLRSTISKESFVLQGIMICSNSIMQLLKFASLLEIKRFEINGDDVFKDCSACGTSGEVAVKSLCEFLGKCKNIERIEFGKCRLNGSRMLSIVSSLSESLIKEIYFKEEDSKICDTELVQMLQCLPRKCTIYLKSKRVSIVFKANENDLDVSNHNDSKALGYETFLANIKCLFPRRFTGLSVETYGPALEYLSENTNLKMITLIGSDHYSLKQDKVALKRRFRELSKSLTSISLRLCLCCYSDYCDILEYLAEAVHQNDTFCLEITVTNDRLSLVYHLGPICNFFQCCLLQVPYLTVLSLNGNSLGADGTVALLDFLRLNPQLTVLKASNCELTDDLFTDTHYWETSSLKKLKLKQNNLISVEGWTSLLQSLRHNTSLIKLNCYCYHPRYFGKAMNEMLISNKYIQYLTTCEYSFHSQYNTESLARALIQNLTLKEIRYGLGIDNVDDLEREIRKLKRDRDVTISPEWKLKIRLAKK